MGITKKEKLLTETSCDLCGASMGTSLIDAAEYPDWLKHTTDLLAFEYPDPGKGGDQVGLLCWECIKRHGHAKEYERRVNDLTYPKAAGGVAR